MKNTKNTNLTAIKDSYFEKYDSIKDKLSKKDLQFVNDLIRYDKYEEGLQFLTKKESGVNESEIRIEKNEQGILIHIPNSSILPPENTEKNFIKLFDIFQWYNKIKGTKKIQGTDGKIYGVQVTILEYK